MTFRVSGKNIDIGEALQERVRTRIAEVIEKYFDRGWSGHLTLERDGAFFRADCALHLSSGIELQAHGAATDPYQSCDIAADRIEKRLRRYKRRLRDRHAGNGHHTPALAATYVLQAPDDSGSEAEENGDHPAVIAESQTAVRRLSVAEAVADLDMTGVPVVVFRHGATGRVNVVYRRADGNIGWVDPPAGEGH